MSLPSPSFVTNSFQQMAIVLWNVFPILVFMVHRVLSELDHLLFPCKAGRGLSPERHLRAARFAYSCAMIVSAVSHLSYMLLGTFTMLFPFMFHLEYARAFSPKKMMVPPFTWDPASTIGEGVLGFMFWDQIFKYATMFLLANLQLRRVGLAYTSWKLLTLSALSIFLIGPGSVCLALNWIRDEHLSRDKNGRNKGCRNDKAGENLRSETGRVRVGYESSFDDAL